MPLADERTHPEAFYAGLRLVAMDGSTFELAVVARLNPVRFIKQKPGDKRPAMPIGQALTRMTAAAKGFKLDSVSNSDLAWVAVGAGASE